MAIAAFACLLLEFGQMRLHYSSIKDDTELILLDLQQIHIKHSSLLKQKREVSSKTPASIPTPTSFQKVPAVSRLLLEFTCAIIYKHVQNYFLHLIKLNLKALVVILLPIFLLQCYHIFQCRLLQVDNISVCIQTFMVKKKTLAENWQLCQLF